MQVVGHDRVQVEPEKELDERSLDENIAYVQVLEEMFNYHSNGRYGMSELFAGDSCGSSSGGRPNHTVLSYSHQSPGIRL